MLSSALMLRESYQVLILWDVSTPLMRLERGRNLPPHSCVPLIIVNGSQFHVMLPNPKNLG